jgi:hypothetical protein
LTASKFEPLNPVHEIVPRLPAYGALLALPAWPAVVS